VMKFINKDK